MSETLGQFIRNARGKRRRSVVCARIGWRIQSLSNLELGYNDVPRDRLPALLKELGVPREQWADVLEMPIERRPLEPQPEDDEDDAPTEAA